jgi:hypothetical protein
LEKTWKKVGAKLEQSWSEVAVKFHSKNQKNDEHQTDTRHFYQNLNSK